MSKSLKNILSETNKKMSQEELLEYLKNDSSADEKYEVEKLMNDDPFTSDAMDGLQEFKDQQALPNIVNQLNNDLNREIKKKKRRKKNPFSPTASWIYFAILLILLICIIGYLLIKRGLAT